MELSPPLLFLVATIAGSVASVAGFGIGSLLTPLLATVLPTPTAVALVSIPHLAATSLRLWLLRTEIDRPTLLSFGAASALGGLLGALINTRISSPMLTMIFGVVLLLAGTMELTSAARRWRIPRPVAMVAGAVSGALGGLVGNQGGIRSAALLAFDLSPRGFVATATAAALLVDLARMPVYAAAHASAVKALWAMAAWTTLGALVGTVIGHRILNRIPAPIFRRVVAIALLLLGGYMLTR